MGKRLAVSPAKKIWKIAALTCRQALERMPGWSIASAYRVLGRRNVQLGRRRK